MHRSTYSTLYTLNTYFDSRGSTIRFNPPKSSLGFETAHNTNGRQPRHTYGEGGPRGIRNVHDRRAQNIIACRRAERAERTDLK